MSRSRRRSARPPLLVVQSIFHIFRNTFGFSKNVKIIAIPVACVLLILILFSFGMLNKHTNNKTSSNQLVTDTNNGTPSWVNNAVAEVSKKYDEQRKLMKQESNARKEELKKLRDQIDGAKYLSEKQKILLDGGYITDQEAKSISENEIYAMLDRYDLLEKNKEENTVYSELQKEAEDQTRDEMKKAWKYLLDLVNGKSIEEQQGILRTAGFSEDSISQIGKLHQQTGKIITAEDIING